MIMVSMVLAGETLLVEHCDSKTRALAGTWNGMCWTVSYLLLTPIAFGIRTWTIFQIVISLVNLLFMYYIWWV